MKAKGTTNPKVKGKGSLRPACGTVMRNGRFESAVVRLMQNGHVDTKGLSDSHDSTTANKTKPGESAGFGIWSPLCRLSHGIETKPVKPGLVLFADRWQPFKKQTTYE